MSQHIYSLKAEDFKKAGPSDLVEINPIPGQHPLILPKRILEALTYGIAGAEFVHISGATGTGKSSLVESMKVTKNFKALLKATGFPEKPLRLYPIEMSLFDSPSEVYFRRSLNSGNTYDEDSPIVSALKEASGSSNDYYHVIWLKEIGRCHTAAIQGALLNLMKQGEIWLRQGAIHVGEICWIADSNYAAAEEWIHTLVTFDDALKRRFTVNIKMDFLSESEETRILQRLAMKDPRLNGSITDKLIMQVVKLGSTVRRYKEQGKLASISAPSIYGYLSFLRLYAFMQRSPEEVAMATLLGNAGAEDERELLTVLGEIEGFSISRTGTKGEIAGGQVI